MPPVPAMRSAARAASGNGTATAVSGNAVFSSLEDASRRRASNRPANGDVGPQDDWDVLVQNATESGEVELGKFRMNDEVTTTKFCKLQVHRREAPGIHVPQVMCAIAKQIWNLKPPQLIISVTGGAQDFALSREMEQELLKGLMGASKRLQVWFISGGSDVGVMKYVGDARQRYAAHAPLIGIAPWQALKGREHFNRFEDADGAVQYGAAVKAEARDNAAQREKPSTEMNRHHSHFFFIDPREGEGNDPFGGEIKTRSMFESLIAASEAPDAEAPRNTEQNPQDATRSLPPRSLPPIAPNAPAASHSPDSKSERQPTSSVCICVQGGPGSIQTVKEAVKSTPVFLVKGVGKASDLISDIVLMGFEETHTDYLAESKMNRSQKMLFEALEHYRTKFNIEVSPSTWQSQLIARGLQDKYSDPTVFSRLARGLLDEHQELEARQKLAKDSAPKAREPAASHTAGEAERERLEQEAKERLREEKERLRGALREALEDHKDLCTAYTAYFKTKFDKNGDADDTADALKKADETWDALKKAVSQIQQALECAASQMCWVHNLADDTLGRMDFTGSLLRCILNGQHRQNTKLLERQRRSMDPTKFAEEKSKAETELFRWQLSQALQWGHAQVLTLVIENSPLDKSKDEFKAAVDGVVHEALVDDKENSETLLDVLLEFKASLKGYTLPVEPGVVHDKAQAEELCRRWNGLLERYDKEASLASRHAKEDEGGAALPGETEPAPGVPANFLEYCDIECEQMKSKLKELFKRMKRFEADVRRVAGCEYKIGEEGSAFDLLLWAIMMNRKELAQLLWSQCRKPVRTALTACILYRKMIKMVSLEPVVEQRMEEAAAVFEQYATGVMELALKEDLAMALDVMEEKIPLWGGRTVLDLAIQGECMEFVGKCIKHAVDRRFCGDLDPYKQSLWTINSFELVCIVCILSLGTLAPRLIKFNPPPLSEATRYPTQRRVAPVGFPRLLSKNKENEKANKDNTGTVGQGNTGPGESEGVATSPTCFQRFVAWWAPVDKDADLRKRIERLLEDDPSVPLSATQLSILWDPTFSFFERWNLFWRAPAVLFLANAIVTFAVIVVFTTMMMSRDATSSHQTTAAEVVVLVYFCCTLPTELFQISFDFFAYIKDLWNILDMLSLALFMAGFVAKTSYPDASGRLWPDSVDKANLWYFWYSIALCLQWLRLLRVLSIDKQMGVLVITIQKMFLDIFRFGLIFLFLWIGFAFLMRGSTNEVELYNPASDCEVTESATECWRTNFMLTVFLQMMGEFFNDTMQTDAEVTALFLIIIVMNILLLNLLIAIMTSTFDKIKGSAEVSYIIDRWNLAKDFSLVSLSIPPPINVPSLVVDSFNFFFCKSVLHLERKRAQGRGNRSGGQNANAPVEPSDQIRDYRRFLYGPGWHQFKAHLARNVSLVSRFRVELLNRSLQPDSLHKDCSEDSEVVEKFCKEARNSVLGQTNADPWRATPYEELKRRRAEDAELNLLRDAFAERCRTAVIEDFKREAGENLMEHMENKIIRDMQGTEDRTMDRIALIKDQVQGIEEKVEGFAKEVKSVKDDVASILSELRSQRAGVLDEAATVVFTQDSLDADNFSSAAGVCELVNELAKERKVHLIIDVETASHDLRLPRFRPGKEKVMLSSVRGTANFYPAEHGIEFRDPAEGNPLVHESRDPAVKYSLRTPADEGIEQDTLLVQQMLTYLLHQVFANDTEFMEQVHRGQVRLSYVQGITEQGLWTPMVPNTFLFYDAVENKMRTVADFKKLETELEKGAWDDATGGPDGEDARSDWRGYFPETSKETRLAPQEAEQDPLIQEAFGSLRSRMRAQLAKDIAACKARQQAARFVVAVERWETVLEELKQSSSDVYMIVCAPAGFAWSAYRKIRQSARGARRVQLISGCALTWDGADNIVGMQWNEFLNVPAMRQLHKAVQQDQVATLFTPTQLFKWDLKNMDESDKNYRATSTVVAQDMHERAMAELQRTPEAGSGFTTLGYQGLWNAAKRNEPQPIFDPLAVFVMILYVKAKKQKKNIGVQSEKAEKQDKNGGVQAMLKEDISLLPVHVKDDLKIDFELESSSILVPKIFSNSKKWFERDESSAKVKLQSPFTDRGREQFSKAMGRWYGVESTQSGQQAAPGGIPLRR